MQSVQTGDKVQFFYNGKSRNGVVHRVWGEAGVGSSYRPAGFCVDHGGAYKSYRRNKVAFLAKSS